MSETSVPMPAKQPFWKLGLVLWVLGLCGIGLVLPYALHLEGGALQAAAAQKHVAQSVLLAASLAQSVVLLGIAVFAGLWAARKLGLGAPLLSAWLSRGAVPKWTWPKMLVAIVAGALTAVAIVYLNKWAFSNVFADLKPSVVPNAWQGFLASFYGGIDEEILLRLGMLSLLALLFRTLVRAFGAGGGSVLPAGVFWAANIVAAIVFGLGHLPAAAAIGPLTTLIIVRTVVLNAVGGLVFGALYRYFGLEWAMASHFSTDIVLHVLLAPG